MKVLIITTSFPAFGGHHQSPFVYNLCKHLAKKHEVHVVCPFYRESKASEEILDNIHVHRFRYMWPLRLQTLTEGGGIPSNLKRSFWAWIQLALFIKFMFFRSFRVMLKEKPDVIHAQWALSAIPGAMLKLFFSRPLILTTRGAALNMAGKSRLMSFVMKRVVRACDMVTPNNIHHVEVLKKMGVPEGRIRPTYNGVDLKAFGAARRRKAEGKSREVLFVGWLIERKGLEYLIKAMEGLDANLTVVGDGLLRQELEELAGRKKVRARFVGSVPPEKIPGYYKKADVLVLPSTSEGRPNVVLEAMASKVPVIASDIPGVREVIKHRENGMLFKPRSVSGLRKALVEVLDSPKLRKMLADNGWKTVKGLSWENCAGNYEKIYKRALGMNAE